MSISYEQLDQRDVTPEQIRSSIDYYVHCDSVDFTDGLLAGQAHARDIEEYDDSVSLVPDDTHSEVWMAGFGTGQTCQSALQERERIFGESV